MEKSSSLRRISDHQLSRAGSQPDFSAEGCTIESGQSPDGNVAWSPVYKGFYQLAAQLTDLKAAGYRGLVSLETHWHGAATHKESTWISWAGMKQASEASGTF